MIQTVPSSYGDTKQPQSLLSTIYTPALVPAYIKPPFAHNHAAPVFLGTIRRILCRQLFNGRIFLAFFSQNTNPPKHNDDSEISRIFLRHHSILVNNTKRGFWATVLGIYFMTVLCTVKTNPFAVKYIADRQRVGIPIIPRQSNDTRSPTINRGAFLMGKRLLFSSHRSKITNLRLQISCPQRPEKQKSIEPVSSNGLTIRNQCICFPGGKQNQFIFSTL